MLILLTGLPGIGKTTVLERLVAKFSCHGFVCAEIREGELSRGGRVGFQLRCLQDSSQTCLLATIAKDDHSLPRVGRYQVHLKDFEEFVCERIRAQLANPHRLFILDEIGKMELISSAFRQDVLELIRVQCDASWKKCITIATLPLHGKDPLLMQLRALTPPQVCHMEVTVDNRDHLPHQIEEILTKSFSFASDFNTTSTITETSTVEKRSKWKSKKCD